MNNLLSSSFERRDEIDMDIEIGRHRQMNSGELGLDTFFKQVQEIDIQFDKLNKLLRKLQDAHEESKVVTKADAMRAIKQRMAKDIDEVGRVARFIKTKIEDLDRDNMANRQKTGGGAGSGIDRSRTSTTISLKKKFKDKMFEFQKLKVNIQQEYREVVERRVFTVTGTRADEEMIERLIETGDGEQIFQKAIREQGRGHIVDTLAEIQQRHDAVREVETKLHELHQIFLDLSVLVDAQGDMLNNIESQVSKAVDHVQAGNKQLTKAKKLQRNKRKWALSVMLILLIIIILVIIKIKPWVKSA